MFMMLGSSWAQARFVPNGALEERPVGANFDAYCGRFNQRRFQWPLRRCQRVGAGASTPGDATARQSCRLASRELLRVRLAARDCSERAKAPSNYWSLFSWTDGAIFGSTDAVSIAFNSIARRFETPICGRIYPLLRFAISGRLLVPLEPAAPFLEEKGDARRLVPHAMTKPRRRVRTED